MTKQKGQLIAKYKNNNERKTILEELKKQNFKCGHPLVKLEAMDENAISKYFNDLPFVIDFDDKVFFATNVTCLAGASSSERGKKLFTEADTLLEILRQ